MSSLSRDLGRRRGSLCLNVQKRYSQVRPLRHMMVRNPCQLTSMNRSHSAKFLSCSSLVCDRPHVRLHDLPMGHGLHLFFSSVDKMAMLRFGCLPCGQLSLSALVH